MKEKALIPAGFASESNNGSVTSAGIQEFMSKQSDGGSAVPSLEGEAVDLDNALEKLDLQLEEGTSAALISQKTVGSTMAPGSSSFHGSRTASNSFAMSSPSPPRKPSGLRRDGGRKSMSERKIRKGSRRR